MNDGVYLSESSIQPIQETIDIVRRIAPGFSTPQEENKQVSGNNLRGYLCQGVSRGQSALCAIVSRQREYRNFKIDLAGIIYVNHPDSESQFKLRFRRKNTVTDAMETWFDTEVITVEGLTMSVLLDHIERASMLSITQGPLIPKTSMLGTLGHPFEASNLSDNDELYPPLPSTYRWGDMIESKIGSWLFSIHRSVLPENDEDFDIKLYFSIDPDEPIQLAGPAVMSIYEVSDAPTYEFRTVTDGLDVASPTPLRGGSKVMLSYFDDIGYSIVAANVREYLFEKVRDLTS